MWYQIKSYINFLLKSNNQHGIHSPFVYDLITKCFYDKKEYPVYSELKKYRNKLFQNYEIIEITDFGAGSRVFKSNERKVSAIAKNAGITPKRQKLLFRLVNYFNSENILELGASLGLGTTAMTLANPSAKVDTVEGCSNTSKVAQGYFDDFNLKNIALHNTTFEEYFSNYSSEKFDFVYIDGNHNKENTLQYFKILLDKISNNSVLIFDDIYWSPEMTEAWQQIIHHSKVTVSIDTFYWGFVFFRPAYRNQGRKEQEKQHFTIRV